MIYELSDDQTIKFWKFWNCYDPDHVKILRDEYKLRVSTTWNRLWPSKGVLSSYVSSIEGDEKDILFFLMKL